MTIGIGVLATDDRAPKKPNTVILMADTMGSYGDVDSHQRLHKTFNCPDVDLYATAADRIDRAAALIPMISSHVGIIPKQDRSYGNILGAIAMACFHFKGDMFRIEVLPKLRISPESFERLKANVPEHVDAEIQKEWRKFHIGCELIIGGL